MLGIGASTRCINCSVNGDCWIWPPAKGKGWRLRGISSSSDVGGTYRSALRSTPCDTGPTNATTSGAGLSGCGPATGGRSVEASRIAEIDVRARPRAIRRANACAEFFCCFFMWSWGVGVEELEVSGANFFLEEESFRALSTLSQAKSMTAITSKHTRTSVMMQACRCRAKLFETLTNKASENC